MKDTQQPLTKTHCLKLSYTLCSATFNVNNA